MKRYEKEKEKEDNVAKEREGNVARGKGDLNDDSH